MNPHLLSFLRDPNDQQSLELHAFAANRDGTIREGALVQPHTHRWYPIRDGIPSLFIDALRVGTEGQSDAAFVARHHTSLAQIGADLQSETAVSNGNNDLSRIDSERRARDEQAEDYDRMLSLQVLERIETPAYRNALVEAVSAGNQSSARALSPLLEAGCGTGRFTDVFADIAHEIVAIDMSRDSIERNRVRHGGRTLATVHYVHADLTHLPLRDAAFGSVAHVGVYEHIPSRELRTQFLSHARRVLKAEGVLLLSAYRYGGLTKIFPKEGEHDGGIPFTRFREDELRGEVEPFFDIETFRANLGIYMSMLSARPRIEISA